MENYVSNQENRRGLRDDEDGVKVSRLAQAAFVVRERLLRLRQQVFVFAQPYCLRFRLRSDLLQVGLRFVQGALYYRQAVAQGFYFDFQALQ